MRPRTVVIVNPAAGAGRVARRWDAIAAGVERSLGGVIFRLTSGPGDAIRLTREAVDGGATHVFSLGGDGTHNEVVCGIAAAGALRGEITLGVLPAGTGGDFRRILDIPNDPVAAAVSLASASPTTADIGVVDYLADDGGRSTRHFLNIASFGISGLVDRIVNRSSKRLGGRITFYVATLLALRSYDPPMLRLTLDDQELGEVRVNTVAAANGRFLGGGMMIAPNARVADGALDVTVVRDGPLTSTIGMTRSLYQGTQLGHPLVDSYRGACLVAEPLDNHSAWLDIDGEAPGRAPLTCRVIPGAIRVLGVRPECQ